MKSPVSALLAGIAAVPGARRVWEDALDRLWGANRVSPKNILPEVVIGSGLNAAVYCAIRVLEGKEPPIILESESRAGGVFAASRSATFYLNSRNRPGGLSIPRNQGALNFLPGSMVQPSDLSGEEYQVNADLAFAIRSVFALCGAKVVPSVKVVEMTPSSRFARNGYGRECYVALSLDDGRTLKASRVIVASGIGTPRANFPRNERTLNFRKFLGMLDQPFPFRGMKRVAVIGAGDSGKCAIEALTGQGPIRHMSVASLDWPSEIVWWGQQSLSREEFENCNRPRYKRIGTLLEPNRSRPRRIQPRLEKVSYIEEGYDCVKVNGESFDLVVECTGFERSGTSAVGGQFPYDMRLLGDMARVGPRSRVDREDRIYFVGPAAEIPRTESERLATPDPVGDKAQREALVAAYRYAGRTAMLARALA